MLIHELARQTGLTPATIRYYEHEGLLDKTHSYRAQNNYRHYTEAAVERLLLIKQGQAAGFTLAEMRELIDTWYTDALTLDDKRAIVLHKIAELERRIAELEAMRATLLAKLPLMGQVGAVT
ncbi:MAG: MerR family DNA-binding protein [Chloroflexota bacterium]|nr:MerR family DNA-binding protein [Chloroflexota bacterium]